jgi:DNA-binding transcriptional ArsR family regulator
MMSTLSLILSSRVRAGLFHLLFGLKGRELHVRELARQAGLHEASIRQELKKLRGLDLVSERRDGNRAYFRANTAHPLYPEIHRMVLKTTGLVELVGESLSGADIDVAFIFGSVAQGLETAQSDVDLMVIGNIGLRKLASLLAGAAEAVGREINPHVMTRKEYRQRQRAADHFVTQVLHGSKLYVIGKEDDLNAMAQ